MTNRLPSFADIKGASRGVGPHGYVLMTVVRPFGPALAWIAFRLGLRARQVTYVSTAFAFLIVALAAGGGRSGTILAPALIVAWELIDVTDGTMARALGQRDNFGGFLDYVAGITLLAFLPLALSIGAASAPDGSLARLFSSWPAAPVLRPAFILVCGGAISAVSMYMRVINRTLQIRFGDSLSDDEPSATEGGFRAVLRAVARNIETVGGAQAIILAAAAALGWLEAVLFLYLAFYLLLLLVFAISVHRRFSGRTEYLKR